MPSSDMNRNSTFYEAFRLLLWPCLARGVYGGCLLTVILHDLWCFTMAGYDSWLVSSLTSLVVPSSVSDMIYAIDSFRYFEFVQGRYCRSFSLYREPFAHSFRSSRPSQHTRPRALVFYNSGPDKGLLRPKLKLRPLFRACFSCHGDFLLI